MTAHSVMMSDPVLIVDDEQMNIAVITTMLQVNGVASDSCASGTSCLAKVRNRI